MRGTLTAFQFDSMDAFRSEPLRTNHINGPYVDGISVTTVTPRQHIWTYAVGLGNPAFPPTSDFLDVLFGDVIR